MRTQSTSGASITTLDLNSRRMAGEMYSTAKHSVDRSWYVRVQNAFFSTGWLYLCNGITSAKKSDQPHLSENVAHS